MALTTLKNEFAESADASIFHMNCLKMLKSLPDQSMSLIITSPPYNIGKEYEKKRTTLAEYKDFQKLVITECHRVLKDNGSICWQVGNHVDKGEVIPLDSVLFPIFMRLGFSPRNRIIWHFVSIHAPTRGAT